MNNTASYGKVLNDLWRFRRLRDYSGSPFDLFDNPVTQYFKIFFDFDQETDGLLNTYRMFTAEKGSGYPYTTGEDYYNSSIDYRNTAFLYLVLNNELERADMLRRFVQLLSDINADSPWYFSSIGGIDNLLTRGIFDKESKLDEDKKITITCLPDSVDQRIGTLLDLYKSIAYSYYSKRVVLPENLRKFNMSICIFSQPIKNIHDIKYRTLMGDLPVSSEQSLIPRHANSDSRIGIPRGGQRGFTSSKIIELKGCEFVFNSNKSGYNTVDNKEGFENEYTIEISVREAFEHRFNEGMGIYIGDYILTDMLASQSDSTSKPLDVIPSDIYSQSDLSRFASRMIGNAMGSVKAPLSNAVTWLKGKAMGNLSGFNLHNAYQNLTNLSTLYRTVSDRVEDGISDRKDLESSSIGKNLSGRSERVSKLNKLTTIKSLANNI